MIEALRPLLAGEVAKEEKKEKSLVYKMGNSFKNLFGRVNSNGSPSTLNPQPLCEARR
jgi:hypothetical protein